MAIKKEVGEGVEKPAPHEAAAKFPGDPLQASTLLLAKIAAHVNGDKEDPLVTKWAAAFKATYTDQYPQA